MTALALYLILAGIAALFFLPLVVPPARREREFKEANGGRE